MPRSILLSIGILILAGATAGAEPRDPATSPLTLSACIDHALEHNPKTRAAYLAARSSKETVAVAEGAYLPTADLGIDGTTSGALGSDAPTAEPGFGATARLTLSYLIFDGTRRGSLDGARARLEMALLQERSVLLDVALDVEEV